MTAFQYQDEYGDAASGPCDSDVDLAFDILRDALQDDARVVSTEEAERLESAADDLRGQLIANRKPPS